MSDFLAPDPVIRIGEKLVEAGFDSFWVGPGLRDCLSGSPPSHFELSTNAPVREIRKTFPNGVVIAERPHTLMVPGYGGCVDVMPFRAGRRVESDLARRDFTLNAIAFDMTDGKWIDPHGGRGDLEAGLIRAVGSPSDCIDTDPIRALRAIRLAATRGWEIDETLEAALERARIPLCEVPREPVRRELVAILLSPAVGRALDRLDHSRIASALAPGAAPGAGALVARLPRDVELRLTAWLRGARARTVLQRLRFPRRVIDRVELLLRHSAACDLSGAASRAASARSARRLGARNLAALVALGEAEIELAGTPSAAALRELDELRSALASLREAERAASERGKLAFTGADVMACLGCAPGRRVGRALDYLAQRIRLNPSLNTPDALRDLLNDWKDASDEAR